MATDSDAIDLSMAGKVHMTNVVKQKTSYNKRNEYTVFRVNNENFMNVVPNMQLQIALLRRLSTEWELGKYKKTEHKELRNKKFWGVGISAMATECAI